MQLRRRLRPNDPNPGLLVADVVRDLCGRRTSTRPNRHHLDESIRWLFRSQNATGGGGSAASYNPILGWDGPYPETSGYIIPTLYEYDSRFGSPEARRRATAMARWLLTTQKSTGGFPEGVAPSPDTTPSVFNTGQILLGLVRAYEETGDESFREAVRRAAEWLVSVQHEDGYWDAYDYRDTVHSYSSRIGWSLLVAADVIDEERLRDAGYRNLSWVAGRRLGNGWFADASFDSTGDPYLHTIAYTIRGLLEGAVVLDDATLFEAARESADRLLEVQERDGVLRGEYDSTWHGSSYYCLTGNAQVAVVWLRLADVTGRRRYRSAAEREVEFLKTVHRVDAPLPIRGGLPGSYPIWKPYLRFRYPNWATKFFADALLRLETETDAPTVTRSAPGRMRE